ncbi:hypothetical protein [Umezawaea sp. Da 62-37]|uniref:hypothetical protein n=1 Tax=Umezawaea sp. Da 62-37 TaxID=3075927 RepID=UPI0028F713BE|nr:hypothetical protein [Umezawaea sp. Da 62-37]WNV84116.1 hypothetical protein RM788_39045 [Umezawaea sp. Da 62-37]
MGHARSDDAATRTARRALGALALIGTTAVVWFGFVDPADAHTPTVKTSCVDGRAVLVVEVRDYNGRVTNTIGVADGGQTLENRAFGSSYRNAWSRSGTAAHQYRVVVRAGDDRTGDKGFSFERTVQQPPCPQGAAASQTRTGQSPVFGFPWASTSTPASTTATTTTTLPTTTTTTPPPPPPPVVTSSSTTTTTTSSAPPVVVEPPAGSAAPTTATGTSTSFALVPPLVSLVEPPVIGSERTSTGSETAPGSSSSTSTGSSTSASSTSASSTGSSSSSAEEIPGTSTTRGTTSSPASTSTTRSDVVVIADDKNLPTTGASVAIPLLFGLCLFTAGGVVVFSMRGPRKRGKHAA